MEMMGLECPTKCPTRQAPEFVISHTYIASVETQATNLPSDEKQQHRSWTPSFGAHNLTTTSPDSESRTVATFPPHETNRVPSNE